MITITRRSPLSKKINSMVIPMTEKDYDTAFKNWMEGTLIQDAFPNLSADHREFIKTGITPEEWEASFGE